MKTDEVLRGLQSLIEKHGWSAQLVQANHIRLKGPKDQRYTWNPLAALAHHHGGVNLRWEIPGANLGLEPEEIDDFHRASDCRWYRPQLRRRILEACGLEDRKFTEVYLFLENLLGKSKMNKVLRTLSSDDRAELESVTVKGNLQKVEKIVLKY